MAETIKLTQDVTLKHHPNLGEEIEEVEFSAGDEFSVLQEWKEVWLAKSSEGKIFNVKKAVSEPA